MYARLRTGQDGFTLIEAMIAMVVLSFGLLAVSNLFIVAATSNFVGSQSTASANLASEQLEALRTVAFSALVPGGSLTADVGPAAACPGGPGEYSCSQTVAGVGTVRVRWTIVNMTPGSIGITVVATPITGLASGHASSRLTTIRTCTLPGAAPINCSPV